jgi:hypothetical protein
MVARFASTMYSIGDGINLAVDVANAASQRTVTSVTSSAPTLTAAQMVNGIVTLSGQTAAQTVTTDTATAIVAAIPNAQIGQTFEVVIQNGHTSSGTATLSGGTGVTITNTYATAAQPITTTRQYRGVVTAIATPAVTIYPVGQVA